MDELFWQRAALFAAIILPLWNIPLIARMIQRRSSQDLSLSWLLGVWTCLLIMVPSGIRSADVVWRVFSVTNVALFSAVVLTALFYRRHSAMTSEEHVCRKKNAGTRV